MTNATQAREELKAAYAELHALVQQQATEDEKKAARRKVLAKHWQVFEQTSNVDDMPRTADSGY